MIKWVGVADVALNGPPNQAIQVPPGYVTEDLNGDAPLDANNNPITSFNLNNQGQAIVEVKTGGADLTANQAAVYAAVQSGNAMRIGGNAADANMAGQLQSTPVIVLRKQ